MQGLTLTRPPPGVYSRCARTPHPTTSGRLTSSPRGACMTHAWPRVQGPKGPGLCSSLLLQHYVQREAWAAVGEVESGLCAEAEHRPMLGRACRSWDGSGRAQCDAGLVPLAQPPAPSSRCGLIPPVPAQGTPPRFRTFRRCGNDGGGAAIGAMARSSRHAWRWASVTGLGRKSFGQNSRPLHNFR